MEVVLLEHDFLKYRNEPKRFQIMTRTKSRNGLNHVFPGEMFTLMRAEHICNVRGWKILAVGDGWHIC